MRGLLRRRTPESDLRDTIEEIIEETAESPEAAIGQQEQTLLRNIFKLRDLTAYDVMVPRVDIVSIRADIGLADLVTMLEREAHSRVPVYRESLDDAFGMVHMKDLLRFWDKRERFKLDEIVRKVLFVAPSMRVLDLLLEMRKTRIHMALVVDEYGGVDGLVTIEDLVEEIVGEIEDEHDVDEGPRLFAQPDGTMIADARLPIEDFERQVGPIMTAEERETADIDTIGGLLTARTGRVPGRGEVVADAAGFEFEVLEADPRRLKRLRLRRRPPAPADAEGSA
ncbi:MAG: HlyC/CorC family transporter [Alphaproteobacteria bacterium]|nr:HlyC/CorC family transporter [Alphaproteobacteria bacterium]